MQIFSFIDLIELSENQTASTPSLGKTVTAILQVMNFQLGAAKSNRRAALEATNDQGLSAGSWRPPARMMTLYGYCRRTASRQ